MLLMNSNMQKPLAATYTPKLFSSAHARGVPESGLWILVLRVEYLFVLVVRV